MVRHLRVVEQHDNIDLGTGVGDPEFAPLFRTLLTDGSLRAFFNDTYQHLLARFLHGCLHIHSELLQGLPT